MNSLSYFNTIATQWNQMRSEYFEEELKQAVIATMNLEGKVVADLGAGTGFLSLELANEANLVFAIDQSQNMLKELSQTAKGQKLNSIFPIRASMTEIPLFDESLDFAYSNMALHHVEQPDDVFREVHRLLKPCGQFILSDVMKHDGEWAKVEMHDVWLGFTEEQLSHWAKDAGFVRWQWEALPMSAKGTSSDGIYTEAGIFKLTAIKGL